MDLVASRVLEESVERLEQPVHVVSVGFEGSED